MLHDITGDVAQQVGRTGLDVPALLLREGATMASRTLDPTLLHAWSEASHVHTPSASTMAREITPYSSIDPKLPGAPRTSPTGTPPVGTTHRTACGSPGTASGWIGNFPVMSRSPLR